ncbi:MAG: twin-arginine translocase TatA/TatE family subunit [Gammaproteobacteria bacterium]
MGIGVQELLVILLIVGLVFGTKKLKNLGSDLGGAIKGFRDAFREGENTTPVAETKKPETQIEGGSATGTNQDKKPD